MLMVTHLTLYGHDGLQDLQPVITSRWTSITGCAFAAQTTTRESLHVAGPCLYMEDCIVVYVFKSNRILYDLS